MKYLGKKIYLRPMTVEDTDDIVRWRNTEYVRDNFIYRGEFTKEGHLNWIRTMVDTGKVSQYIIVEKDTDRSVGSVFVRDIDHNEGEGEYGIFIGERDALNHGYGNESASLMIKIAREELRLKKLKLRVYENNVAAIRSYEYAGFKLVPDLKEYKNDKNVVFMEVIL